MLKDLEIQKVRRRTGGGNTHTGTRGRRGQPSTQARQRGFPCCSTRSHLKTTTKQLPLHLFSSVWKGWALETLWSLTSSGSRWNIELVQVFWMSCGEDCSFFSVLRLSGWLFLCRQASDIPRSFQACSPSAQGFGLSQAGRPFSAWWKNRS